MKEQDFLNDIMGFDPSNLDAFHPQEAKRNDNPDIYKTNPIKFSTSEDGHYHSQVRVLYNPFNFKDSIVKQVKYSMSDVNGFFRADSRLAIGDTRCPIFSAWKKLHFAKDASGQPDKEKDDFAKRMFDKAETQWVLVQIIEDDNQPDLVGKFKVWKLPMTVWEKMQDKMNPAPEKKKAPQALMDYLFGPVLSIDVTPGPDDPKNPERKQREISYTLCDFESDACPIIKTDGTQLFTDEELELIDAYNTAKSAVNKAKTEKAKAEKQAEVDKMTADIKKLYIKALDYMKENALNVSEICGYHEWDEALTTRVNNWIKLVLEMKDPSTTVTADVAPNAGTLHANDDIFEQVVNEDSNEDDLPF